MLSKTEKEYLEGIEEFEDKHGLNYAQVIRHRIRKRVSSSLEDLSFIIDRNGSKRTPAKAYRRRTTLRNLKGMQKAESEGELSPEAKEFGMKELSVIGMFDGQRTGKRREEKILYPAAFSKLIYKLVKRDSYLGKQFIESIKNAQEDLINEDRMKLLERYRQEWVKNGHEWLMEYFRYHDGLYKDVGFDNVEDCIEWLSDAGRAD